VRQGKGKCGVAPREWSQVKVGGGRSRSANGVNDDHLAGRLGQPVVMLVGGRCRRVCAPYKDAARVTRRARVEAVLRGAVQVLERDVAGVVANRVQVDLGGPEPVEEALRKVIAEQR